MPKMARETPVATAPPPTPTPATLLGAALMLAWPLLVLVLLPWMGAWPVLALAVALACWRLPAGRRRWGLALAPAALAIALAGQAELGVRAWPVLVNAGLLAAFAWSLHRPPSLIERLARRREPDLPDSGVRYTRRVTQVWCGFFLINGAIALWTALYADLATWTLYNGGIAYMLCGALFAVEWCIRQGVKRRASHD